MMARRARRCLKVRSATRKLVPVCVLRVCLLFYSFIASVPIVSTLYHCVHKSFFLSSVDCGVSDWSAWSACSASCGGGVQKATRTISQQSMHGGAACPSSLSKTRACNTQGCPQACVVSAWGSWTTCSVTCGGGRQRASRTVVTPSANGGAACPALSQTQACNQHACPVACVVSSWSAFSSCSTKCGGGTQTRTRSVVTSAANGGAACPSLSQSQTCNTQACPGMCVACMLSTAFQHKSCVLGRFFDLVCFHHEVVVIVSQWIAA